jgi:hypothetical protein
MVMTKYVHLLVYVITIVNYNLPDVLRQIVLCMDVYIWISRVDFITCHEGPEEEHRCSSTLSLTSALDGVGGQRHAPAALPLGNTLFPLYRKLGGPQSRSRRVRKISPPPGFDRHTVQPVTSRYTHTYVYIYINKIVYQDKPRVLCVLLGAPLKCQTADYPQPTRIQYRCLPCVCTRCSTDLNLRLPTSATNFPVCSSSSLCSNDCWRPRYSPTTLT